MLFLSPGLQRYQFVVRILKIIHNSNSEKENTSWLNVRMKGVELLYAVLYYYRSSCQLFHTEKSTDNTNLLIIR